LVRGAARTRSERAGFLGTTPVVLAPFRRSPQVRPTAPVVLIVAALILMVSALILMVSTLVLVVTATLILIVALVGTASCLRSSLMLQNTTLGISKWGLLAKLFYLIVTARSVLGIPSFSRSGPELLLLLTSRWLDWFHMSSVTVLHKPVFRTIISSQLLKKLTLCWAVPA